MIPRSTRLLYWDGPLPETGQYLRTKAGSTYAIIGVKPNLRPNPKSKAKLDLLRLSPDDCMDIPEDAKIYAFQWVSK